jgi:lactoylglutathione lyase
MTVSHHLFETHISAGDLDRSVAFYREVVGLELAHITDDHQAAFLWIGPRGRSMLGVWAAGSAPQRTTVHIAFATGLDDVLHAPEVLRSMGVTPLDFDARPAVEPVVLAWMPAVSVYFRDPDGHLLEYIAMLPDDPRPERGVLSWGAWQLEQRSTNGSRQPPR